MKQFFDWKRIVLFVIISGGLILITHSLLMSIGIMLLLLVIDRLLANWEKKKREENDI